MHSYLFILGNTPALSVADILNKFKPEKFSLIDKEVFRVDFENKIEAEKVIKKLGGTIKIVELLEENFGDLLEVVGRNLPEEFSGKYQFGISCYGGRIENEKKLAMDIKRELKARGISCRWVSSRGKSLSSVVVKKNNLIEKGIDFVVAFNEKGELFLGKTVAVQDFEGLSFRDYKRPKRDSHSGMIPPKLAQIMINIGLSGSPTSVNGNGKVLLDPFCGSGTILMEAMLLGVSKVIGSDVSEKAVKNTRKNLEWVQEKFHLSNKSEFEVKKGSATELSKILKCEKVTRLSKVRGKTEQRTEFTELVNGESRGGFDKEICQKCDLIVTEPYLGPQKETNNIEKAQKDLEVLYSKALQEFKKVLKDGGRVVMVWPVLRKAEKEFLDVKIDGFKIVNQIPEALNLETTPSSLKLRRGKRGTIVYGRKGQRVWREIVVMSKE